MTITVSSYQELRNYATLYQVSVFETSMPAGTFKNRTTLSRARLGLEQVSRCRSLATGARHSDL